MIERSIHDVAWADSELEAVNVDYDNVVLDITLSGETKPVRLICAGYVGFSLVGFWDEIIIDAVRVFDEHDFLTSCKNEIARRYPSGAPDTGQPHRNVRNWSVLAVSFIDGATMFVAAIEFRVELRGGG